MKSDPKSSSIIYKDWRIQAPIATIAYRYDNLSRVLKIEGVFPEGYRWDMLVQCGDSFDIIPLADSEAGDGLEAILTAEQMSKSGMYSLQLRGILLEDLITKRHTNVIQIRVPDTIIGDHVWPEIPTSFTVIETKLLEINAHPPVPGKSGFWDIWDVNTHAYAESKFPLPSEMTVRVVDGGSASDMK